MGESTSEGVILKHLETPDAKELAELYLVMADLEASLNTIGLYFDKFAPRLGQETQEGTKDAIIGEALLRDGIVQFMACFSEKEVMKLRPEDVYGQVDRGMEIYQSFHDLRDAYIAHNFGAQRVHEVSAVVHREGEKLVVGAIGQSFMRFAGVAREDGDHMLEFLGLAYVHMRARTVELERKVLADAKALSQAELKALPDLTFVVPAQDETRLSRSKFRAKTSGRRQPFPEDLKPRRREPE